MSTETLAVDVVRRAELIATIADLVEGWQLAAPQGVEVGLPAALFPLTVPLGVPVPVRSSPLPFVGMVGSGFACNTALLDLSERPVMLRLFQTICTAKDQQLSRDEILREVYQIEELESRPARYIQAQTNNAVKMVSRARILASTTLSQAVKHGVEWFPYDLERRRWGLFRLRNEFFGG